jgi:hypothetical protein
MINLSNGLNSIITTLSAIIPRDALSSLLSSVTNSLSNAGEKLKQTMPTIGGGRNDTCGKVLTIMVYVIVGLFLFTLICDLCSEGYEYFNGGDSGFVVEYYKKTGCPWCVKFDESQVYAALQQKYGDKVTFKTYDATVPEQAEFVPKDLPGVPAFAFYNGGKLVGRYSKNGDRSFADMSAWIDALIVKSQRVGWAKLLSNRINTLRAPKVIDQSVDSSSPGMPMPAAIPVPAQEDRITKLKNMLFRRK